MRRHFIVFLILWQPTFLHAQPVVLRATDTYKPDYSTAGDALPLLQAVAYEPREFDVRVSEPLPGDEVGMFRWVRYDSPRPDESANDRVNRATLEWYRAMKDGQPVEGDAPAMLILHSLDARMIIGRGIARGLSQHGVHRFLLHTPGYGERIYQPYRPFGDRFFVRATQAIADARRARDVIAVLPGIDKANINLQGTSLGGFYATVTGALDAAFARNFLFLAGGDLYRVFTEGAREAQWIRESMAEHGIDDAKLKELCRPLDPVNSAHRLPAARTWLFSAKADQVVPPETSRILARRIGLAEDHHLWYTGDHYTVLLYLEQVLELMARTVHEIPEGADDAK